MTNAGLLFRQPESGSMKNARVPVHGISAKAVPILSPFEPHSGGEDFALCVQSFQRDLNPSEPADELGKAQASVPFAAAPPEQGDSQKPEATVRLKTPPAVAKKSITRGSSFFLLDSKPFALTSRLKFFEHHSTRQINRGSQPELDNASSSGAQNASTCCAPQAVALSPVPSIETSRGTTLSLTAEERIKGRDGDSKSAVASKVVPEGHSTATNVLYGEKEGTPPSIDSTPDAEPVPASCFPSPALDVVDGAIAIKPPSAFPVQHTEQPIPSHGMQFPDRYQPDASDDAEAEWLNGSDALKASPLEHNVPASRDQKIIRNGPDSNTLKPSPTRFHADVPGSPNAGHIQTEARPAVQATTQPALTFAVPSHAPSMQNRPAVSANDGTVTLRHPFEALDRQIDAPRAHWVSSSANRAEASFEDPTIGLITVRAHSDAAGVHASVVPGSIEAAQTLASHISGLNTHMASLHPDMHRVTLAPPSSTGNSSDPAGGMTREQGRENHGDNQHSSGHPQSTTSTESDPFIAVHTQSELTTGNHLHAAASPLGGVHISVLA
jgi:hypothetical protein